MKITVGSSQQTAVLGELGGIAFYVPDTAGTYTSTIQVFGGSVTGIFVFDPPIAVATLSSKWGSNLYAVDGIE